MTRVLLVALAAGISLAVVVESCGTRETRATFLEAGHDRP